MKHQARKDEMKPYQSASTEDAEMRSALRAIAVVTRMHLCLREISEELIALFPDVLPPDSSEMSRQDCTAKDNRP